jgi:hypothetical protein
MDGKKLVVAQLLDGGYVAKKGDTYRVVSNGVNEHQIGDLNFLYLERVEEEQGQAEESAEDVGESQATPDDYFTKQWWKWFEAEGTLTSAWVTLAQQMAQTEGWVDYAYYRMCSFSAGSPERAKVLRKMRQIGVDVGLLKWREE